MDGYITIGTKIDTSGIEKGITSMEKNIDRSMKSATNSITSAFNYIKFSIINTGISMAINEITGALQDGITRLDTMKNYENVMSNLGIGGAEAQASIERLSEALRGLPTTLDSAALSVQRLTSANGNIKASTEMFLAMNNAILAGGASAGLQATAIEQLSQAYTKGKPDMMEWRTMMMAMPAQLTQVAKVMGYMNADALGEALREGKVSMNEFMITLTKMNKEGIGGFKSFREQAENATGGISTSLQNVKTALARAWADILEAVGRENIVAFFQTIINVIDALAQRIVAIIKLISQAVSFISNLFGRKTNKGAKDISKNSQQASASISTLGSGSSDASKGMNKAAKSANKLNKELKQLAGFDEMEVLKKMEQANSGGGGTSGGSVGGANYGDLNSIDFDDIDGGAKKSKKSVDDLLAAIMGLIGGIIAFKMHAGGLKSLGIGLIIMGVVTAIEGLMDYLNDPTWKNFGKTIEGIGLTVLGLGAIFGNLPLALAGALVLIIGLLATHWDEIKKKFGDFIQDLRNKNDIIRKIFGDNIADIVDKVIGALEFVFKIFDDKMILYRKTFDDMIALVKAAADGDWKTAWNKMKSVVDDFFKWLDPLIKGLPGGFGIVGAKMGASFGLNFLKNIKTYMNNVLAVVETALNAMISATNKARNVLNKIPGVNLSTMNKVKLPRLAKGGIINLPGRGVPVGGAIGGEAGPEGVIPLTDNQQMELLGEAIGKHITINALLNNYMNARLISRELHEIKSETDFAFNR